VDELPFPPVCEQQLAIDRREGLGKPRLQQVVRDIADRLIAPPSVLFFGRAIPVGDDIVHVTDKNRVVRLIEEACLLSSSFHFNLKSIAGLPKALLDSASDGYEAGDNERPAYENKKIWQVSGGDLEGVNRFREEVGETGGGKHDSQYRRPNTRVPGGDTDRQS
jgi:hypothetical protein